MTTQAFEGVTVIEDARYIAGPYAGKLFADMGARVIKIEPPDGGDMARACPPFAERADGPDKSLLFAYLNTSKESVTLDMGSPKGRELYFKLLEKADLLIQDRPAKELDALGIGQEKIAEKFPALVAISITPFGLTGPYKDFAAHHINICHASGESHLLNTNDIKRPPVKIGAHVGEYDVGVQAASCAAAALIRKYRTGKGACVDISKQEVIISLDKVDNLRYANDKFLMGRAIGAVLTGGMVKCKDGHVVIVVVQDNQWKALVEFLGNPEWAKKRMCKNEFTRAASAPRVNGLIADSLKDMTIEECYHGGQSLGVPVAAIYRPDHILESKHLEERGFFVETDLLDLGKVKMPGCPARLSASPWLIRNPAPPLGSSTPKILGNDLEMSAGEIETLRENRVI